jgi:hypothetical protein
MNGNFFNRQFILAVAILSGFTVLGLLIRAFADDPSASHGFLIEGILLSSVPFWLRDEKKGACKKNKIKSA